MSLHIFGFNSVVTAEHFRRTWREFGPDDPGLLASVFASVYLLGKLIMTKTPRLETKTRFPNISLIKKPRDRHEKQINY